MVGEGTGQGVGSCIRRWLHNYYEVIVCRLSFFSLPFALEVEGYRIWYGAS